MKFAEGVQRADKKIVPGPVPDWLWLSKQCSTPKVTQPVEASQYVSAHPWKALSFAFAVGLLIRGLKR